VKLRRINANLFSECSKTFETTWKRRRIDGSHFLETTVTFDPSDAKNLFLQASELPAEQRSMFLDRTCAAQPELRTRVENLLRSLDHANSFLARPVAEELDATHVRRDATSELTFVPSDTTPQQEESLSFLEPCSTPGRIGRLPGYEIVELIGRGGMGIVLKAYETTLQRIVAVKVLAPAAGNSATGPDRFLREGRAAAAVSHDHVVTIFAAHEHGDHPFIVMECIVGQSLQQKIDRSSPLGLKETLRIGMQIAAGLAAAHKQGLVHRDIKPSNILLENGVERVKITDFGLARAVDDAGMTQTGYIAGTPQYMSPEQAMGERVDPRSDLFSLGSVLYSMCTGRVAFRADTTMATLRRVCDDTPRPIREINPEVPEWLEAIIGKLMAKRPEDRFQTAAEVAELLSQCLAWAQRPEGHCPPSVPKMARKRIRSRYLVLAGVFAVTLIAFVMWAVLTPTLKLLVMNKGTARFDIIGHGIEFEVRHDNKTVGQFAVSGYAVLSSGWHQIQIVRQPGVALRNLTIERWRWGIWKSVETIPYSDLWLVNPGDRLYLTAIAENDFASSLQAISAASHGQSGPQLPPVLQVPATETQIQQKQEEWSKQLSIPVEFTNSIGMQFRLLPPGRFQMGTTFDEIAHLSEVLKQLGADDYTMFAMRSSAPQHPVQLTQPYYVGQFEVTVAQFRQFLEEANYVSTLEDLNPRRFVWRDFVNENISVQQAVCGVSWTDARAFCEWLSKKENRHYDLPTEAQWEYACRGGNDRRWSYGNQVSELQQYAVFGQAASAPSVVGSLKPNAFGLYDMHGNVEEWCVDWHKFEFYATSPLEDPINDGITTDPASGRVVRGGRWVSPEWLTRSATRVYDFPAIPAHPHGFRVVLTGDLSASLKEHPVP